MRLSSTRRPLKSDLDILTEIEEYIQKARPPVLTFEKSIRETPFKVLISVLISARTKDEVTHEASKRLFSRAQSPSQMAKLDTEVIAELIYPVGFFRQKAKHISRISKLLSKDDTVPDQLDQLVALPGVGPKTANLVLALAFDIPRIAVDTHVFRISARLGWASGKNPETTEEELMSRFPKKHWIRINQLLVGFGQSLCRPISPRCPDCFLTRHCPYFQKNQT